MRIVLPVIAAVALVGCAETEPAQLLVPEDVDIDWDARFDALDEGVGVLLPVDVMVYESETGEPLAGVALRMVPRDGAAVVLDVDGAEMLTPELGDDPEAYWNVWDDSHVAFLPPVESRPSSLEVVTDAHGLARAYVWVDGFGSDGASGFEPVQIDVFAESTELRETFRLIPR